MQETLIALFAAAPPAAPSFRIKPSLLPALLLCSAATGWYPAGALLQRSAASKSLW
jgi:hypothetical protein